MASEDKRPLAYEFMQLLIKTYGVRLSTVVQDKGSPVHSPRVSSSSESDDEFDASQLVLARQRTETNQDDKSLASTIRFNNGGQ